MNTTAVIFRKMTEFYRSNSHDINHFMKVYAFAENIGRLEGLDENTQQILEAAALTHDIAIPLCREKYGCADGKYQELEGAPMVREFLRGTGLTDTQIDRVSYLVGHHHTLEPVDGIDYRILLEADFLVNADEGNCTLQQIEEMKEKAFRTDSGLALLDAVYRERF